MVRALPKEPKAIILQNLHASNKFFARLFSKVRSNLAKLPWILSLWNCHWEVANTYINNLDYDLTLLIPTNDH